MRVSLLNARQPRLLTLQDHDQPSAGQTIELVRNEARLRASIKFSQGLVRTLLIGMALLYLVNTIEGLQPWGTVALMVAIAMLIWLSEFLVEGPILPNPEPTAIRLTPIARPLVAVLGPILGILIALLERSNDGSEKLVTITEESQVFTQRNFLTLFVHFQTRE